MRVLLADDKPEVRSALRLLLEQQLGLSVVGEADEGTVVLSQLTTVRPDLVLLDWDLPGGAPESLVAALHDVAPRTGILVLSARPEARLAALKAGANGFVSKGDPPEAILAAIRVLGASYYP